MLHLPFSISHVIMFSCFHVFMFCCFGNKVIVPYFSVWKKLSFFLSIFLATSSGCPGQLTSMSVGEKFLPNKISLTTQPTKKRGVSDTFSFKKDRCVSRIFKASKCIQKEQMNKFSRYLTLIRKKRL